MLLSFVRALVAFLVIFLAVAWIMDGSSSFKSCIQEMQRQASNDYPKKTISAFRSEISIRRDCFISFVKDHKDEVLAAFTILLTFATIFLWFATGDLVRGAERTAQRQLRAYVGIAGMDIKNVTANEKPIITLRIQNFGQSPAYRVHYWVDSVVDQKDAGILKFDPKKFSGESVVNPADTFTIISRMTTALTDAEVDAILNDALRLYLVGEIRYRDAFGKWRKTFFRHESAGKDIIAMGRLKASHTGNEST